MREPRQAISTGLNHSGFEAHFAGRSSCDSEAQKQRADGNADEISQPCTVNTGINTYWLLDVCRIMEVVLFNI